MKTLQKLQRWIITGLIAITPVFFLPITQEFFVTNKTYFLFYGLLVTLALVGLTILVERKLYIVKSPFTRILFAFLAIKGLSIYLNSPNKIQALYSLPTGLLLFGTLTLLFTLILYTAGRQRHLVPVFKALSIGTVIAGVIAIVFAFGPLTGANLPPELAFLKNPRFSPLGNLLDSAMLFAFVALILVTQFIQRMKEGDTENRAYYIVGTLVSIIATIVMVIGIMRPVDIEGNPTQRIQLPPLSVSWYAGLETLKTPMSAALGVGTNNFEPLFARVKPLSYNATDMWQTNFTLARSALIHLWVETGLLGLIALLLVGVYAIREIYGLKQEKSEYASEFAVGGIFVAAVLLLLPPSFVSFFILFVYIAALAQVGMRYEHESVIKIDSKNFVSLYMAISVVLIASAVGLIYFTKDTYASEIHFKKSIDAIRANDGQLVYTELGEAIRLQPRFERYRGQFAQINLLLANNLAQKEELTDQERQAVAQFIQQAIAEGKALVALNPTRAANWNTLAVIYRNVISVAEGADAWTVATYQEAIRRDANNPQLRLSLGGVYYALQQYPSAITNFQQAVSLKPNWANAHYNLAWALYQNGNIQDAAAVMQNVITLLDESSDDYSTAQENLVLFQEDLKNAQDASQSGTVEPVEGTDTTQQPLELPQEPEPIISPPIELPEDAGPEGTINNEPESTPSEGSTETPAKPSPTQAP